MLFSVKFCTLLGLALAANRGAFENCQRSAYCQQTAEQIGQWRWRFLPETLLTSEAGINATFVRVSPDTGEVCEDHACQGATTTTAAPLDASDLFEVDQTPDRAAVAYEAEKLSLSLRLVDSGPSGQCTLRISGQLATADEFEVPADIFDAPRSCGDVQITAEAGSARYLLYVKRKLFALFDTSLPAVTLVFNDAPILHLAALVTRASSHGFQVFFSNVVSQHGLPEHTVSFDLPRQFPNPPESEDWYRFYNADVFEYELNTPMAMYAAIPWLASVHAEGLTGLLHMQPSELYVRLADIPLEARTDASMNWNRVAHFIGEHSRFDLALYVTDRVNGLSNLTRQMSSHTGRGAMPPTAALGLHQARWNYDSSSDVEYVSSTYIKHQIPLDYIWLDIDHSDGRQYFTWNDRFSDPEKMRLRLLERKQNLVVIVDPHVKSRTGYKLFDVLTKNQLVAKTESGDVYHGWCWPGDVVYADTVGKSDELIPVYKEFFKQWPELYAFGESAVCSRWAGGSQWNEANDLLLQKSVNVGVWIDMNEPSVFNGPQITMPKSVRHGKYRHSQVHNAYGMYYAKAIYKALQSARPHERPFVLTRSAFVGSQKYGAIWTGDNTASLKYLRNSIPMILSMALSGYSFVGADVSGFFGEPDPALYLKSLDVGIWYPFLRIHSTMGTTRREIYTWSDHSIGDRALLDRARDLIDMRYALIPFWQRIFSSYVSVGTPVWSSLLDYELRSGLPISPMELNDDAFIVGDTFLIRPRLGEAGRIAPIWLAEKWRIWPSLEPAKLEHPYGVFVRKGSIIFTKETKRLNVESQRYDPYTMTVILPDEVAVSGSAQPICESLIVDDGKTDAAEHAVLICAEKGVDAWKITLESPLPGGPWSTEIRYLRIPGGEAMQARVEDRVVDRTYVDKSAAVFRVDLSLLAANWTLTLS